MTATDRIERERAAVRLLHGVIVGCAALAAATVLLAAAALLFGDARWIGLPRMLPLVAWLLAVGAVGGIAWWGRRVLARRAARADVALAVERELRLRDGSVRAALEVERSGPLGARAAQRLANDLAARDVLAPETRRRLRRRGALAGTVAGVALLGAAGVAWSAPDGWRVLAHPIAALDGSLLPPLAIVDAPASVLRGEALVLHVAAPWRTGVTLHARPRGASWRTIHAPVPAGATQASFRVVADADLELFATDGRGATDTIVVQVTDKPFLGDVAARAVYPSYLGRAPETIALGDVVRIPRGTALELSANASTLLRDAALVGERERVALDVDGRRVRGRLVAASSGGWRWQAATANGGAVELPQDFSLDVLPDSAPRVAIVTPAGDLVALPGDRVAIQGTATDDHGLASVRIVARRVGSGGKDAATRTLNVLDLPAPNWNGGATIDLGVFGLQAGDELRVSIVATDASPWRQEGRSRELVVRLPDRGEQRSLARAAADSAAAAATAAARAQQQLERRTAEAARSRGPRPPASARGAQSSSASPMGHEQSERAKQLASEQREMSQRVQDLQRTAEQLERQLREAGALDSTLARQLADVRQLLKDAITPEMQERLRQLEQNATQLQRDETRQSLADLAEQQKRLREQLEKSAEMLKRAALEGAMQTLRDEARELAKKERELADSLARGPADAATRERRAQEAKELERRARDLEKDVGTLGDRLEREKADLASRKMEEAEKGADASAEAMRRAAERAQQDARGEQPPPQAASQPQGRPQGQPGAQRPQGAPQQRGPQGSRPQAGGEQAAQAAREAAERMEQAAQKLSEAREEQIGAWKEELTKDLDRSAQEMLQMARQQEQLAEQASQGASEQQTRGAQGALQQGVQKAQERMNEAARKSSLVSPRSQRAMAEARQRVERATKEAGQGERNRERTSEAMKQAAEALNQAAAALVRDRERANSAQSASGFTEMMEQMRQLAQQQGQLNASMSSLFPQGQPRAGQQGEAAEKARQLARQQRSIARQLDELGDHDETGRSEELAREARQLAQALERSGASDPATLARQQRLFKRLLDAGRSLERDEREETGKRESRPGDNTNPFIPQGTEATGRAATRYREPTWEELRGLNVEERRLIIEYFRRLNAGTP